MGVHKVKLYIRIRREDGADFFAQPVWNRNRTLRAGYAEVSGTVQSHPEGIYYLRYLRAGKRVYCSVGANADAALTAFRNVEHDLQAQALGRSSSSFERSEQRVAPVAVQVKEESLVPLEEAICSYLGEIRRSRAPKTIAACERILSVFQKRHAGRFLSHITRNDLLDHMASLKKDGLSERTVFNHISRINTLLKANGFDNLLRPADWPRYDEKAVRAYHSEQLSSLFAVCSAEERQLFEFFLITGFREQEVAYMTWANVDFRSKVISVWSKPEMGFRVKDKEERSVPVPDSLIISLAARKEASASTLIFPGKSGQPDGHFLRRLQRVAYRGGLNCGECLTRNGTDCGSGATCSQWGLHTFRKTFSTLHVEAGVSPSTIQRWLGHADLATTMRYLAAADIRSERTRSQVNTTFAGLSTGGAG